MSKNRRPNTWTLIRRRVTASAGLMVVATAIVAAVILTGWTADRLNEDPAGRLELLEERMPNNWFFAERAFPQGKIPLEYWRSAQLQAAHMRAMEGPGADAWTPRGPDNIGGRITDIVIDPGNSKRVWAGTAEGGVFRTTDEGQSWTPLFDDMPTLSIGALALDPGDSDVLYAGTGEVNPGGGSVAYGGSGIYRSSDGGDTWQHLGLEDTGSIGRIRVDALDSDTIFVAAMGHLWQDNAERGVYRSTDGGVTWNLILFVNDQTGCVDLIQRPDNPAVLLAAMWQRIRQPEYYDYGGPGCAIHRSTDGGDTWTIVTSGLPAPGVDGGRIGLSLCASQSNIMHAVYTDHDSGAFAGLFRSTDSGATWTRTTDSALAQAFSSYGWWFSNVRTHPNDPDSIYVLGLEFWRSVDGGASYFQASGGMHVDHHALDFSSGLNPVAYCGNDGGVYRSDDGGGTWIHLPDQPHVQVYRLALDPSNPDAVYVGAQDNGTLRTLTGATDDWGEIFGGDGFQPMVDANNPQYIWAQYQYGSLFFSNNGGLAWYGATNSISGADRRNWNTAHVRDPSDPSLRYFGTNRLYQSTNVTSWSVISPDLTGGPHGGNNGQVDGILTSISVSPVDSAVIWTGSDDGYVQVTTDTGATWNDTSATLPERWVTSVRADPFDRETAYATISGFRWTEPLPHVFRTTDMGASWIPIAANLPEAPVNDLLADPDRPGRLVIATDVGVFETADSGGSWAILGSGLPNVICTSLALNPGNQSLIVGTYGRSLFALPVPPPAIFADGFESGNTSAWSGTQPPP